jgi:hypothetical protein
MVEINSTNEEKVKLTATPVTGAGNPAAIDGALRVSVVSGDASFTQDPAEPNAFYAVSGSGPGDTTYLVEADADLGEGVVLIQDTVTYHVSGAQAASFGLVASAPEVK